MLSVMSPTENSTLFPLWVEGRPALVTLKHYKEMTLKLWGASRDTSRVSASRCFASWAGSRGPPCLWVLWSMKMEAHMACRLYLASQIPDRAYTRLCEPLSILPPHPTSHLLTLRFRELTRINVNVGTQERLQMMELKHTFILGQRSLNCMHGFLIMFTFFQLVGDGSSVWISEYFAPK